MLKRVATIESVASSTRIEGVVFQTTTSFLESATGGNRNTIKRHLTELVGAKLLQRQGRGHLWVMQPLALRHIGPAA